MGYMFSFERLETWQLSKRFVIQIYKITDQFPNNEKFGLVSQINRAAVSVPSNLAEGTSRTSSKDQAHLSQLAFSSLMEVICQLSIAHELKFIKQEDYYNLRKLAEEISNKINSLRNYQLNS